jgi:hypothetical protein
LAASRETRASTSPPQPLAVLDREHRARRQHVARGLAALLVEQGHARTQILLRTGRAAEFRDDALGDAGRFVGLLGERLALDQILELHDAALFGDHRHHERIPLGDPIALRHDMPALAHQMRAVGDAVRGALAPVHVDDRDLARTRHGDAPSARLMIVGRSRSSIRAVTEASRFEVSLSCAAPPMWKVRIVSCVPGSPIDLRAMTPTASPMLTGVPRARSRP